jgi:hypothetical protein
MLRLISNIIFTQQPTSTFPDRNKTYTLNFVNDVEINSTWKNLTTTAKLILPRNIYIKSDNGIIVNWYSQGLSGHIVGSSTPPIIMRGDRISISLGYYYNPGNGYISQMNEEFNGFITKINPKTPMEIDCEDNMWLLKQCLVPNNVFPATQNLQEIIQYCLNNPVIDPAGINYKYVTNTVVPALAQIKIFNGIGNSQNINTNIGSFRTQNETLAAVLMRLRKDYKLECFFRKDLVTGLWNNLYCSGIVYYFPDYLNADGTFKTTNYGFQKNIVSSEMQYQRKDDIRLGIKAYSVSKYELNTTNSAGSAKTKNARLEAFVGDKDGDIRTQFFWPATNTTPDLNLTTLTAQANQRLNKLKYDGWRGDFTSFGLPYVQHGQAVSLTDNILKEQQGVYLVKGTKVKFGMGGFRRSIAPHVRIDLANTFTQEDFQNGI